MPSPVPRALDHLTASEHLEAPVEPGRACLAMAIAALEPDHDARALFDELPAAEAPAPGQLALAGLRRGFHVVLRGPVDGTDPLGAALDAGLVHRPEATGIRHVLAALEAGHPALVLVNRADLHEASPSGPHWILALDADDDAVRYHDPLHSDGPDEIAWEPLSGVIGHGRQRLMLELAPPTRIDRG